QSNIIKQLDEKMSKVSGDFRIENNACILEAIFHYNLEHLIEKAVIPFECSKQSSCDHIQSLEYFEESKSCGDCGAESENYIKEEVGVISNIKNKIFSFLINKKNDLYFCF
ncbi:hypothetical protein RFI_39023, partial [Reticulomyxa filosa]